MRLLVIEDVKKPWSPQVLRGVVQQVIEPPRG